MRDGRGRAGTPSRVRDHVFCECGHLGRWHFNTAAEGYRCARPGCPCERFHVESLPLQPDGSWMPHGKIDRRRP